NERSPQLVSALEQIQTASRKPSLETSDLASACHSADILVVAQARPEGKVSFSRYDGCRLVASFDAVAESEDRAVLLTVAMPPAPARTSQLTRSRWKLGLGIATLAVSIAVLVAGSYYVSQVGPRRSELDQECKVGNPCSGETLARLGNSY